MIPAKEFEGELWIKASDHHQAIKAALAQPVQEPVAIECTCKAADMPFGRCCKAQLQTQEPMAWLNKTKHGTWSADALRCEGDEPSEPLYTGPPQRPWVGLTDEDIEDIFQIAAGADEETHIRFARAIESALRSKNK
jgi:hypothetical protein